MARILYYIIMKKKEKNVKRKAGRKPDVKPRLKCAGTTVISLASFLLSVMTTPMPSNAHKNTVHLAGANWRRRNCGAVKRRCQSGIPHPHILS
jgi:hypothetical protein